VGDGADLVLILGGDGTINEAAMGMMHTGVPMGILPGGTANVLARELGLGLQLDQASERLGSCRPVSIAVGSVTGAALTSRCFLSMCGAGLDAQIVTEVRDSLKSATGKFAFWAAGFTHFLHRIPAVQVEVDGESFTCGFALISRVKNYGGNLVIASGASLLHDHFEVVLFEGSNPFRYAAYLSGVAVQRVQKMRGVHTRSAKRVEIRSASPVQIDGEFLAREAVSIEILPDALQLLIPTAYR
jgi:diacylglycerol kinase family enzyme